MCRILTFLDTGTNVNRPSGTNTGGGALGGGGFVNPNSNRGTNNNWASNNNRGTNYNQNYNNNRGTSYNYGGNNYYSSSNYARNNYWSHSYGSQAPTYYRSRNNFGGGYYSGGTFKYESLVSNLKKILLLLNYSFILSGRATACSALAARRPSPLERAPASSAVPLPPPALCPSTTATGNIRP